MASDDAVENPRERKRASRKDCLCKLEKRDFTGRKPKKTYRSQ
jgi:hypothetical protein